MDPISIVALVGTCSSLATRGVTLVQGLTNLGSRFRSAQRSANQLADRLHLFNETLDQLKTYLQRGNVQSRRTRATLRLFLTSCEDGLSDIEQHIASLNQSAGSGRISILGRARFVWNEPLMQECERRLGLQLQLMNNYVQLVQLYVSRFED